jgi:hypothetical protein
MLLVVVVTAVVLVRGAEGWVGGWGGPQAAGQVPRRCSWARGRRS